MPDPIRKSSEIPYSMHVLCALLRARGLHPEPWSNPPNHEWPWHHHVEAKTVYCVSGSATFYTRDGDVTIRPGDVLEIPAEAEHAATVGPAGVECVEVVRARPHALG
jgi:mannose-6-phosphate isomerase-like protein (cupin superfamily)